MFRAILWTQWRESRIAVSLASLIALAIPIWSMWGHEAPPDMWRAWFLLNAAQNWSTAYPLLALAAALALATGAWRPDHRVKHVYALTLPIARSRYLLFRYAAGLSMLLCVAIALWLGAEIATVRLALPEHLYAYPVAITFRFFLAGLSAYTLLFAVSGATARSARLLLACLLVLVIVSAVMDMLGVSWNPFPHVVNGLLSPYGPLAPFRVNWMLIDV